MHEEVNSRVCCLLLATPGGSSCGGPTCGRLGGCRIALQHAILLENCFLDSVSGTVTGMLSDLPETPHWQQAILQILRAQAVVQVSSRRIHITIN